MAVLDSDAFAGVTGTSINGRASTNGTWSILVGGAVLINNRIRSTVDGPNLAYVNTATPSSNNYGVQITTTKFTNNGAFAGPACRMSASTQTCYFARRTDAGTLELLKTVNGASSVLASNVLGAWTGSRTLEIRCLGNLLEVYSAGSLEISYPDTTDPITSGFAGVRLLSATTNTTGQHLSAFALIDLALTTGTDTLTQASPGLSGSAHSVSRSDAALTSSQVQLSTGAASILRAVATLSGEFCKVQQLRQFWRQARVRLLASSPAQSELEPSLTGLRLL